MEKINVHQIKVLHSLLNNAGLMSFKRDLIAEYSSNRTTSSKELYCSEADELIDHLRKADPTDRMKKKVISLCYEIGLCYGETKADKKMNMAVVNAFLLRRGYLKKPLNNYTRAELPKLVYQFEQIVTNVKKKERTRLEAEILENQVVESEIKALLFELGI